MTAKGMIVHRLGKSVKAVPRGNGLVEGYITSFGTPSDTDLEGEYFTPDTEFCLDWYSTRPVLYHHGMDDTLGINTIGSVKSWNKDNVGVWIQAQLDLADQYAKAVYEALQTTRFGWSSGSVDHLVKTNDKGQIKLWPWIEASITPTPAQPSKTTVRAFKSLVGNNPSFAEYLRGLDARVDESAGVVTINSTQTTGVKTMGNFTASPQTVAFVRSVLKRAGAKADPEDVEAIAAEVEPELKGFDEEDPAIMGIDDDPALMGLDDDPAMMGFGEDDPAMMGFGEDDDPAMMGFGDTGLEPDADDAVMGFGEDDPATMGFDEEAAYASYRAMQRRKAAQRQMRASARKSYTNDWLYEDPRDRQIRALYKRIKALEMGEAPGEKYIGKGYKAMSNITDQADRPGAYSAAFKSMIRFGEQRLSDTERYILKRGEVIENAESVNDNLLDPHAQKAWKALNSSNAVSVGFAVPEDWVTELNKNVMVDTVMAKDCKVKTTTSDTIIQPDLPATDARRAYPGSVFWPGESPSGASAFNATELALAQIQIPIHVMLVNTTVTNSALEDAAFDLQQTITEQFAELVALEYDTLIWSGTGQGKLKGIVTDTRLTGSASTAVSSVGGYIAAGKTTEITSGDKLKNMLMHLPPSYRQRAKWYANSNTMNAISQLKDGQGRYLWGDEQGLNQSIPTSLLNRPVVYNEFADDIAANAYPLALADLSRGYLLGKRVEFSVRRFDDSTYAVQDQVLFIGRARLGGQVIQPAAFKLLKMAVS